MDRAHPALGSGTAAILAGGLKPKVTYIELFGTHATTGAPVHEKLMND